MSSIKKIKKYRLKVLSRALAEKSKLNDSYHQHHTDDKEDEPALSNDVETRHRNNAVVRALHTTRPSRQGPPPQVNLTTRFSSSRPGMRIQSRAGSHSAEMAQLIENTVWKLDAYDNQPKRMRDKYYAYREWSSRNEGVVVPMDVDVDVDAGGEKPAEVPSSSSSTIVPKSTTGSTNYDASRDPRLQR